jgi:hypothetical protein
LTIEAYIIYLLDVFIHSIDGHDGSEILITLTKDASIFYFNIGGRDPNESTLLDFIKIYALLQFEVSEAWFLRLYTKLFENYQINERGDEHVTKLLMIDAGNTPRDSHSYEEYKYKLQQ